MLLFKKKVKLRYTVLTLVPIASPYIKFFFRKEEYFTIPQTEDLEQSRTEK